MPGVMGDEDGSDARWAPNAGYIEEYTAQSFWDYNEPIIWIPSNQKVPSIISGMSLSGQLITAQLPNLPSRSQDSAKPFGKGRGVQEAIQILRDFGGMEKDDTRVTYMMRSGRLTRIISIGRWSSTQFRRD